jgi:beta-phosphoglucomutase-like phosphatase (HAD superfamily)
VIFDGDGVLIRSMESTADAYRGVLASVRIEIRLEELYAQEGRRAREPIEFLARAHDQPLAPSQIDRPAEEHPRSFASFGPTSPYPGAAEIVAILRRPSIRSAVVTANGRENALRNLGTLALSLDVIVTAEDVQRTRADPGRT